MIDSRMNLVGVVLGRRGTGKTTFVIGDEKAKVPGLLDVYFKNNMKVLIVDTYDHPSYQHIHKVEIEDLQYWKNTSIARVFGSDFTNIHAEIEKHVTNTLIVFEDAQKQLDSRLKFPVRNIVLDSKGKNNDVLFMYHAWGTTMKDLFRYMDFIEVFKTNDSPYCRKDSIGEFSVVEELYLKVKKSKNPFEHLTYIQTN